MYDCGTLRLGRVTAFLLLLLVGASGCDALKEKLYTPRIRVKCEAMKSFCQFENYGDPGRACVVLEIYHLKSGTVLVSKPVCSGLLERGTPAIVHVEYANGDPLKLCMGDDMSENFAKTCEVSVKEADEYVSDAE